MGVCPKLAEVSRRKCKILKTLQSTLLPGTMQGARTNTRFSFEVRKICVWEKPLDLAHPKIRPPKLLSRSDISLKTLSLRTFFQPKSNLVTTFLKEHFINLPEVQLFHEGDTTAVN